MEKIYDEENIFCKMLSGIMQVNKIYEDDCCIVIMDIMPKDKGHSLVIPKARARNTLDINEQALQQLILRVQKVAKASLKAFNADGISIMQYNEPAGGQCVFHLHFHVVPRYKDKPLKEKLSIEQIKHCGELLKSALKT